MKTLRHWPTSVQLRPWQRRALRTISKLAQKDWFIVATPGAGKTIISLKLVHQLLSTGVIQRLLIVTPSDHLRRQWAGAAAYIGIDLDPTWSNSDGIEGADFFGVVVTYQQVSYAPSLYRMACSIPTLVIFDEIHHAADDLDWGGKLRHAFEGATIRLELSGTPFRQDNSSIPFIRYEDGRSRADFEYEYGDALRERVCRPVVFPTYEGRIQWLSNDGNVENSSLLNHISRYKSSERLRTALSPTGDWLRGVLREANIKLSQVRMEGHTNAGGLVVAIDQEHAKQIAELLHIISGERPVLAISEDPQASEKIKEFAINHARWIVAVKMVAEGTDVPRLRIGVYATNVQSELFFRQVVGRFVRMIPELEEQSAYMFIPSDETLVRYALDIKAERDHVLKQGIDRPDDGSPMCFAAAVGSRGIFTPLASDCAQHDTIFDGKQFDPIELAHAAAVANAVAKGSGMNIPAPHVAAILRCVAAESGEFVVHRMKPDPDQQSVLTAALTTERSLSERKQSLRQNTHKLANRLARHIGVEARDVHRTWIELSGKRTGESTEQDLLRKQEWLMGELRNARNGGIGCTVVAVKG